MRPGVGARVVARIPAEARSARAAAKASNSVRERYARLVQEAIPPRIREVRLADLSARRIRAWFPGANSGV